MPWWDELFAERDCQPVDILRPRLWDDDCWDAGALSSLTLYVRRSARSAVRGDLDAEAIPRSAIHPGLFVPARRDVEAMRTLDHAPEPGASPDVDAVAVVERVLDERSAALEAAREERRTSSTRARGAIQRVRRELDELTVAAEEADARSRVEAEARCSVPNWTRPSLRLPRRRARRRRRCRTWPTVREPPSGGVSSVVRSLSPTVCRASRVSADGRTRRFAAVYRSINVDWREATRDLFDTDHYLAQRPGLFGSGVDPVVHYADVGWREGLDPHPLFDTDWYLRTNG